MDLDAAGQVCAFREKPQDDGTWINGGFFVLEPGIFDYIPAASDELPWERTPLEGLVSAGQLMAYRHTGFWKCMDTLRDRLDLEALWDDGAPWAKWN